MACADSAFSVRISGSVVDVGTDNGTGSAPSAAAGGATLLGGGSGVGLGGGGLPEAQLTAGPPERGWHIGLLWAPGAAGTATVVDWVGIYRDCCWKERRHGEALGCRAQAWALCFCLRGHFILPGAQAATSLGPRDRWSKRRYSLLHTEVCVALEPTGVCMLRGGLAGRVQLLHAGNAYRIKTHPQC